MLRRRAVEGMPHQPFDLERLRADWEQVLPEQRDASVLFAAILNQVIDGYGQVLDVIRTRADEQEGHLLDRDRPLREIQIALLEQTAALGAIRRHVMPLRNDLRELRELREPVSAAWWSHRWARAGWPRSRTTCAPTCPRRSGWPTPASAAPSGSSRASAAR